MSLWEVWEEGKRKRKQEANIYGWWIKLITYYQWNTFWKTTAKTSNKENGITQITVALHSNWGLSETFSFRKTHVPFCKENKRLAHSRISPSKTEQNEGQAFTSLFSVHQLPAENECMMIFYKANLNLYFRLVSLSKSLVSLNQFPISCSRRCNCCTGPSI